MIKPTTITVIGEMDCGKSTLIGRLLMETESLSSRLIRNVKKFCHDRGVDFQPAYLVDYFKEERTAHTTVERTLATMNLKDITYTIIDTPGQMMLAEKMVSGLTEAEIVLIVLDIQQQDLKKYNFYLKLVSWLRISHPIIVLNKIDLIKYGRSGYQSFIRRLYREIKISRKIPIVPISALRGDNILKSSKQLPFSGTRSLAKTLLSLQSIRKDSASSFFMPVQTILNRGKQRIALGTVNTRCVFAGKRINCANPLKTTKLVVINLYHDALPTTSVSEGENAGLTFDRSNFKVKRGDILYSSRKSGSFRDHIDVRLYTIESFLSTDRRLNLKYLTGIYAIKKIFIKERLDFRLLPVEPKNVQIASNEFVSARIFCNGVFFVAGRNLFEKKLVVSNKKGDIVAIGLIS